MLIFRRTLLWRESLTYRWAACAAASHSPLVETSNRTGLRSFLRASTTCLASTLTAKLLTVLPNAIGWIPLSTIFFPYFTLIGAIEDGKCKFWNFTSQLDITKSVKEDARCDPPPLNHEPAENVGGQYGCLPKAKA